MGIENVWLMNRERPLYSAALSGHQAGVNSDAFIAKYWGKPGGAERATYQMFLTELAQLLGADTPDPGEGGTLGDYQFEGPVRSEAVFMSSSDKRMDLYKRDCFILEAKQSRLKDGETPRADPTDDPLEPVVNLFGEVTGYAAPKGKRAPRYDRLMADARLQAQRYSLALPGGHRPPPFLIVTDIGRTFELYFDYTGDGRGYGFFPDQQNYRIALTALASPDPVGNNIAVDGALDPSILRLPFGHWEAKDSKGDRSTLEQSRRAADPVY